MKLRDLIPINMNEGVADVILQQLGGRRFIMMTGAKDIFSSDNGKSLVFKIPRAKGGINYVKILYNSMDLYDMEFGMIRKKKGEMTYTIKAKERGVYNDMLQTLFTKHTGLHTHL